ncbi:hypothetical protein NP233_g2877 [Leucocoprinus birnbaumii]|uniref:Uncharacterized protein n=1 Tax=Leucocoprinus birnbaumii TaxID=56174 RepID=A0AAD5VXJ4_9AGAR|nr:hypothetical protein NP233_g2877 [Leucocoprinus birnbaumii]
MTKLSLRRENWFHWRKPAQNRALDIIWLDWQLAYQPFVHISVSDHLNNNDVALETARQASCLNNNDFKKALRTVSTVLESELSSKKSKKDITYDVLHEKYAISLSFTSFSVFVRQAENQLLQLDERYKANSPDVKAAVFFWASSAISVQDLPAMDEFAQENSLLPKKLAPVVKLLTDKCTSLRKKLIEASQNPSRPSSPTKSLLQSSTPRTPRRSPTKTLRELPTRESVKKQRQLQLVERDSSQPGQSTPSDVDMVPPETPTKKRKLESSSSTPLTNKRVQFPPITPAAHHITHSTPHTKVDINPTPAVPSPLRRSARFVLQQEADASMDVDEEEEEGPVEINRSLEVDLAKAGFDDEEDLREEPLLTRRFRPVYQDYKQWLARDAKVLRLWKDAVGVQ